MPSSCTYERTRGREKGGHGGDGSADRTPLPSTTPTHAPTQNLNAYARMHAHLPTHAHARMHPPHQCRAEEAHTCSLLFCVLDGHGVVGELVSSFFQRVSGASLDTDTYGPVPSRPSSLPNTTNDLPFCTSRHVDPAVTTPSTTAPRHTTDRSSPAPSSRTTPSCTPRPRPSPRCWPF